MSSALALTPPPPSVQQSEVQPTDFAWIGKVVGSYPLDCTIWDLPESPHKRAPRPLHDATDYPERLSVQVQVAEVIQAPENEALRVVREATLAFALGREAFQPQSGRATDDVYSVEYCRKVRALLDAEWVSFVAYPIYVDRGNSLDRGPWHSLGTDPGLPNAVHSSLTEARAHLRALLSGPTRAR